MSPLSYDYLSEFTGRVDYSNRSGDLDVDNDTKWKGIPARPGESRRPIMLWTGKFAFCFAKNRDGYAPHWQDLL